MSPQEFLQIAIPAAQAAQAATGIPASITVAQCFLETGYGNHMPQGSNNPFGIKAVAGQPYVTSITTEFSHGVLEHVPQNFAKYDSWADAFTARSKMILTKPWFSRALAFKDDAAKFITELQKGPLMYSTAGQGYVDEIMRLVRQYNLTKYDRVGQKSA